MAEYLAAWKSAHPKVKVTLRAFVARCEKLGIALNESLHGPDLFVAVACGLGDDVAISTVVNDVLPRARAAIAKIDSSSDFVDEMHQRVLKEILVGDQGVRPRLEGYRGTGPLTAWVKTVAMRQAMKARNDRPPLADTDALTHAAAAQQSPELVFFQAQHRAAFNAIFAEAFGALEIRERNVLRHKYLDGLTVQQIGALYQVHHSTIVRLLKRTEQQLFEQVRSALRKKLSLSQGQLDSAVDALVSGLHQSLARVLK
jgi:RNA polymerase sigma-70 factor (ECF subfamily)